MPGSLTIRQASLVLPTRVVTGDLLIEDGVIAAIGPKIDQSVGEVIDGTGLHVLPGAIDPHVHFRDPGKTYKEDLGSGSRAAAAGGVTSFLDTPNNDPPITTVEALDRKLARAAQKCVVHYGFFIGATADNLDQLNAAERTCGIKVYMPQDEDHLEEIFAGANKLIAVHAEDAGRLRERKLLYENSTDPADHPRIRDVQAALMATQKAVGLAQKYGSRLHILHLTSADEVDFLAGIRDATSAAGTSRITTEVCPQHLFMRAENVYDKLGALAQCNPPVRGKVHGESLWRGLVEGTIDCIATDHAPHTLEEKGRGYPNTPSGMPGVEWSLPLMLDLVNKDRCTLQEVVKWMSENPARCYNIPRKGRLEIGYDGDIVLVDMNAERTIDNDTVFTRCGWSPWAGMTLQGWPVLTAVLGEPVFRDGQIIEGVRGQELTFSRRTS